ncbi:MAG: alpha/beta fold hydrolase [Thermoanaerobaculia bacterium]
MSASPDAAGRRVSLTELRAGDFPLESGETLRDVRQAFRLEGDVDADGGNVVLLLHSLTGSPADLGGWRPFVGPGLPVDTRELAVLAPNLLGSCYGTRFRRGAGRAGSPLAVTTRDQARLAALLLDALGVTRLALAAGGSLGGMVALELCATRPEAAGAAIVFAAPASPTAWGAAWNHVHRTALEVAPRSGLALARMVGMLTYRTPLEVERRFRPRVPGTHPVRGYLDYHGVKLVRRFTPGAYRTLLDAIDTHDVGRGRGGVGAALRPFQGRLLGVGIPGDLLYPPEEVLRWTRAAGAEYRELVSPSGHDGFLLETGAVGALLAEALAHGGAGRPTACAPPPAANLGAGPPP